MYQSVDNLTHSMQCTNKSKQNVDLYEDQRIRKITSAFLALVQAVAPANKAIATNFGCLEYF